jgi:1-acyl-sn-glycerol-3-phosphate acyltransferase
LLFHLSVSGVERVPRTGPTVVVSNHVSWLDPVILAVALPRKPAYLALEELWRIRGLGLILTVYRLAIPVHRDTVDVTALKRALKFLQDGHLLIVFPEGGISPDGRLRPFHRGAALLAARSRAPLIPVALTGTRDALPLDRLVPRLRPIAVRVGTPIAAPGTTRDDLARVSNEAAAQIRALLEAPPP